MTKADQELLLEIAEECEFAAEPMNDYSGRGMYGKTTDAVTVAECSVEDAGFLMGILVERTGRSMKLPFRTDSMGRDGMVIY